MEVVCVVNLTDTIKDKFGCDIKTYFIRINPYPMDETLVFLYNSILDLSWTKIYNTPAVLKGVISRAEKTINDIEKKLKKCEDDSLTSEVGEYVISVLGKQALIDNLEYIDIPLAELWKAKVSGNPGFDFYCESIEEKIIFGEAKYEVGKNAYNSSLSQIVEFIQDEKDCEDLVELEKFVSESAMNNFDAGRKGYASAFSSTSIGDSKLISHILKNEKFNELLKYDELLLVAVDINE